MSEEVPVPWDPIPAHANRQPHLDVVHFEMLLAGQEYLLVDVASSWPVPESKEWGRGAWRITFSRIFAFRRRQVGYKDNLPLTRPPGDPALWELLYSAYLRECRAPGGIMRPEGYHVHHYVIRAADAFEVIASEWKVESLPDEWAYPFASRVPALE